jgi:homoserine kinase type II
MAVFTDVSLDDAHALVAPLRIGYVTSLRGITAGIENTNYRLDTDQGGWILTVFERLSFAQLPFYLELMRHLAKQGLPVPYPQARHDTGVILLTLHGKPAAVVNRLPGDHVLAPNEHHCAQLGEMLARMHMAGRDFPLTQPNLRGLSWWTQIVPTLHRHLSLAQDELITTELAFQQGVAASAAAHAVPRGPIHADLFRDNVMFEGVPGFERLTGVFDFYFAGVDSFLFDLGVCLNDWCVDLETGRLVETRAAALVSAYEAVRPMDSTEHRLLPAAMRAAAFRFWVSRLWDWHQPRDAKMLNALDPTHFERVLRERVAEPWHAR